jgi:hypothetical protein
VLHAASDCLVSCWFYIIWQQHASNQASLQTFQVEPHFSLVLLVQHTRYVVGQAHVLTIATARALLQLFIVLYKSPIIVNHKPVETEKQGTRHLF